MSKLVKKIQDCHSGVDLLKMKDEIIAALEGKKPKKAEE